MIPGNRVITFSVIFYYKGIILLKRSKNTSDYSRKNTTYYTSKNKKVNEFNEFGKITFV